MNTVELITIVISVLSASFSIVTYIKAVRHDKRQATILAFSTLQNEVLDYLSAYTKGDIEDISQDNRSDEFKQISRYLSRIEHFSVGVNMNIYDLDTTKRLAGELMIPLYEKLFPVIEKKRKVPGSEKVYDDFERLVNGLAVKEKK